MPWLPSALVLFRMPDAPHHSDTVVATLFTDIVECVELHNFVGVTVCFQCPWHYDGGRVFYQVPIEVDYPRLTLAHQLPNKGT